jgi:beta-1,4-mannosyltransferase
MFIPCARLICSWTEDEDFSLLLDAIAELDNKAIDTSFTVVVVTGKGPLKEYYTAKVAALQLKRFCVLTMWLAPGDYPLLLGCSDLGVCLHTSTSGLDLPMKVVDFFGSGLPVCAVSFQCIGELVAQDKNGVLFKSSAELSTQLESLLRGFPANQKLASLRQGAQATLRWNENWEKAALPVICAALKDGSRSNWLLLSIVVGLLAAAVSLVVVLISKSPG